jgi:hypothetical protein
LQCVVTAAAETKRCNQQRQRDENFVHVLLSSDP